MTCQHKRGVDYLLELHAARVNPSTAQVVGAMLGVNKRMAACQQECGGASPYRDVTVDLVSDEDAAKILRYENPIIETFSELGREMRGKLKRLVKR